MKQKVKKHYIKDALFVLEMGDRDVTCYFDVFDCKVGQLEIIIKDNINSEFTGKIPTIKFYAILASEIVAMISPLYDTTTISWKHEDRTRKNFFKKSYIVRDVLLDFDGKNYKNARYVKNTFLWMK